MGKNIMPLELNQFLELGKDFLFDVNNEVICIIKDEIIVAYISPKEQDFLGIDVHQRINIPWIDIFYHEDHELISNSFKNIIENGLHHSFNINARMINIHKELIHVNVLGKNLLDNPLVNGILLRIHCIHQQQELKRELELSYSLYKSLIESTGNMVWSVNIKDYGLITFNSFMANYYKEYLKTDLKVGMIPKEMLPTQELVNYWHGLYEQVIEKGRLVIEYPMATSNRFLSISLNGMYLDNTLVGISVFVNDVTQVVEANKQLKEEKEKYRVLFDNTNEYVILVDGITFKTKLRNPAALNFLVPYTDTNNAKELEKLFSSDSGDVWMEKYLEVKEKKTISFRQKSLFSDAIIDFTMHWCEVPQGTPLIMIIGKDITSELDYQLRLLESNTKLKEQLTQSILALSMLAELRDAYTAGHQRRVQSLACAIARKLDFDEESIENISLAAIIHDIGKVYVPSEILSKPTSLSFLEFELIKTHVQFGYDIISTLALPEIISIMVLQHHERLDGSGYPRGVKGDAIKLESQIIGVSDVVEAIVSHRPYRKALGLDVALSEIKKDRGIKFDPRVVDACLELFTQDGFAFEE
jgi:HD-GYP domain-containing protein (c-di-GMP phosphodiesterase class II)